MKVKHAVSSRKRHKKVLEAAKGFWGGRSKVFRRASETLRRAGAYSYRDRKNKKRTTRALWIVRINAASRERGVPYRKFINALKQSEVLLSRDMLAKVAAEYPQAFDAILETVKPKVQQ